MIWVIHSSLASQWVKVVFRKYLRRSPTGETRDIFCCKKFITSYLSRRIFTYSYFNNKKKGISIIIWNRFLEDARLGLFHLIHIPYRPHPFFTQQPHSFIPHEVLAGALFKLFITFFPQWRLACGWEWNRILSTSFRNNNMGTCLLFRAALFSSSLFSKGNKYNTIAMQWRWCCHEYSSSIEVSSLLLLLESFALLNLACSFLARSLDQRILLQSREALSLSLLERTHSHDEEHRPSSCCIGAFADCFGAFA